MSPQGGVRNLSHHKPRGLSTVLEGGGQLHGNRRALMTVPRPEPAFPPPDGAPSAFSHGQPPEFHNPVCVALLKWTDQSATPRYACSLRRQVRGVPSANLTQPRVEEKDCEVRPPHLLSFGGRGGAIFSIASGLDVLDPE